MLFLSFSDNEFCSFECVNTSTIIRKLISNFNNLTLIFNEKENIYIYTYKY